MSRSRRSSARPASSPFARLALGVALAASLAAVDCAGGEGMAIHDVAPRQGSLQGEQPVKITGRGFRADVGYRIYFGNKRAESVTVLDDRTLLAGVPPREDEGAVDITVLADTGDAFRVREAYRYADLAGAGEAPAQKGNLAY